MWGWGIELGVEITNWIKILEVFGLSANEDDITSELGLKCVHGNRDAGTVLCGVDKRNELIKLVLDVRL